MRPILVVLDEVVEVTEEEWDRLARLLEAARGSGNTA